MDAIECGALSPEKLRYDEHVPLRVLQRVDPNAVQCFIVDKECLCQLDNNDNTIE
jgi:hypothetical protein